jgi:phosphatidylserine decarboxylase|tara:strand:- start:1513 stop:2157 length:645 start_codon:yes stop_codon:yes gene_type:complete
LKTNLTYPIIAKEGWLFLGLSVVASLATTLWCPTASIPLWIISLFILQFFRDPIRPIPKDKNLIVSAADGRVISIEKTTDPYKKRKAIKVSVFMNVFNVHSNKAPVSGQIINKWYYPGKFFNASLSKASSENERCALLIETEDKQLITCVQIAGLIARRILCYKEAGSNLLKGERYGFIRFGSRVDLYLPENAKINVTLGQKVKSCQSVIAELY